MVGAQLDDRADMLGRQFQHQGQRRAEVIVQVATVASTGPPGWAQDAGKHFL